MKKILLLVSCLTLILGSLTTSGQNRKMVSGRDRINSLKLCSHSNVSSYTVKRNVPAIYINALSGYYQEGFEGAFPPAGWKLINVSDPTYNWLQSNVSPYQGANSAYINYTSAIGIAGEDWMIMPQFTVTGTDSLSFWLKPENIGFPPDSTLILVSVTDTAMSSFTTVLATLAEGLNYPTTQTYEYYSHSLSAFAGQDIYVAIVNKNNNGDGVFIDKVSIGTKPAADASSYSIDVPAYTSSGPLPTATVLNDGSATQTFDVTMTITGGYTSTKTITSLGAGLTQQVTFDPWTPTPGTYTINIQTLLPGDSVPGNDSISKSVTVIESFTNYGWTSKADIDSGYLDPAVAAMNTNDTSYLFLIGGATATDFSAGVAQYAPYSNAWNAINSLNTGAYTASAAGINNKIYFIGGYNPNFTPVAGNQVYDKAAGSWSLGAAMPIPVGDYAMGIYGNYIYCIGGFDSSVVRDVVQIYNTATDTWTSGTALPNTLEGLRAGIVGNKIVVCGGYNQTLGAESAKTYVGTIDLTNPANITWVQVADYPSGTIRRHGGAGSLITSSGLVIFTGGDPSGTAAIARSETFGYDVNSNSWKIGPAKPTPVNNICNLAAVVDNDSLYLAAVGGYDGTNPVTANEWLNLGAYQISGVVENNGVYAFDVYPNPITDVTNISLSLKKASTVKVFVTDVLGNELTVLCDKKLLEGKHKLNWDARTFTKGVYFCNIVVDGKTFTQKIVKL